MKPIKVPSHYDYAAVYMTDRCPLRCSYCITEHNDTRFITGTDAAKRLEPRQWVENLNRLELPSGVPLTLQGGEPFVYPGIWEVLDGLRHPIDILTAMPRAAAFPDKFRNLKSLKQLNRGAPYPNIRVSYHVGQNKLEDIVPRIQSLQDIVSIGLYAIDHPAQKSETQRAREYCEKHGVMFRTKEFLGFHEGKLYGTYKYDDAAVGKVTRDYVDCKNSVMIFGPDGYSYRCHSDLYHKRRDLAIGRITDEGFEIRDEFKPCRVYGMCSECDVKIKNNHDQKFGYTSVTIKFPEEQSEKIAA